MSVHFTGLCGKLSVSLTDCVKCDRTFSVDIFVAYIVTSRNHSA